MPRPTPRRTRTLQRLALFDLDGTLTKGDTGFAFVRWWCLRHPLYAWRLAVAPLLIVPWALGILPLPRLKEFFFHLVRGRSQLELDAAARSFVTARLSGLLKPEALAELERLKDEGCVPVLLSASPEWYVRRVAMVLGIELVAATRYGVGRSRDAGRILGADCRGGEKIVRLLELVDLAACDLAGSVAYSDSKSDLPMLTLVGGGYLVRPRSFAPRAVTPTPKPEVPPAG